MSDNTKSLRVFENEFHYDGRGPELVRVLWAYEGRHLKGFEYYNPEDMHNEENVKYLELIGVEVYSMAGEEVHDNILAKRESKASIFKIENSPWLSQYNPRHLEMCNHYQIVFYDEIYDVICKEIKMGKGRFPKVELLS